MCSEEISSGRLSAWVFAAVVPTVIQLTAGASWLGVTLVALIGLFCVLLRWRWGEIPASKAYAVAMWVMMVLLLAMVSKESVGCWPRGGHVAVALILLALALWSAWKGTLSASGAGSVLFWFFLILYLVLFTEGAKEVQIKWLKPVRSDVSALGCVLLLTPAVAAIHLNKSKTARLKPRLILIGLFCAFAAIITAGVLSPMAAHRKENAFYEMTRSLSLLGQARRFEAVLSAATAMGWFTLMSLYLTICGNLTKRLNPSWEKKGIAITAVLAGIGVVLDVTISQLLLLILASGLWVITPLLTQTINRIKKSQKNENNT